MKSIFFLSLVTSIAAWPALAYEPKEIVDTFHVACPVTGGGHTIKIELKGTVQHGLKKNWFNGNINESPGVYDKDYNPTGDRTLRALLDRNLGRNQWALGVSTEGWFGLTEDQLSPEKKFREEMRLTRGLSSWHNDAEHPDAYLTYEIRGVHTGIPQLTFLVEVPKTGRSYVFHGQCERLPAQ